MNPKKSSKRTPVGAQNQISPQLRSLAVPIDSLNLDPRNARQHDERGVAAVKASLKRFGQLKPIVVQEKGRIVRAGNATVAAARELGWKEIAANVKTMTDAEARAYAIADNRTAELATWDDETLAEILAGLQGEDSLDATVTGYTEEELAALLAQVTGSGEIVEDEVPEPPEEPITQAGDLWLLGDHRVLCGDSTKGEDVERVMGGEKAALCLTDPPYGVGFQYEGWQDTPENLRQLIAGFMPLAREVAAVILVTPGNGNQFRYPEPKWMLSWNYHGIGCGPWGFTCWQPVLAYGADPYLSAGLGCRPDAIGGLPNDPQQKELAHPCPKPIAIWAWLMKRGSTSSGDLVYDPFLGSGTTLIAAEQLGRKCYGIEIEPRYVDVTVQRWEKLTGRTATR